MGMFDVDLGLPGQKKKEGRDKRRYFNKTEKKEILYQQDSKCANCHERLDPRAIHFHHEKAWADGGRSIAVNGRAVCPTCHEILEHKQRLKKSEEKAEREEEPDNIIDKMAKSQEDLFGRLGY